MDVIQDKPPVVATGRVISHEWAWSIAPTPLIAFIASHDRTMVCHCHMGRLGVFRQLTPNSPSSDGPSTAQRACDYTRVIGSTRLARFLQAYSSRSADVERQSGNRRFILTKNLVISVDAVREDKRTRPDPDQYLCSPDLHYAEPPSDY